jgi:hypothetical protein
MPSQVTWRWWRAAARARLEIVVISDGMAQIRRRFNPAEIGLVEFLVAGERDRHQLAVPDPDDAGVDIDGIRYLRVEHLLDMKLSAGIGVAGLRDLADAVELIQVLKLPVEFAEKLNPTVRAKFIELCGAVAVMN